MKTYFRRKDYPIIKYNPVFRDDSGRYLKNEWTSYSDIGRNYNENIFQKEEYERVEELYIKAVYLILNYFNSKRVKIIHIFKLNNLEKFKDSGDIHLYNDFITFQKGDILKDKELISKLLKLRLREYIGELELLVDWKSNSEIIFGFDYYMYLRTNKEVTELLSQINKMGLFTSR